MALSEPITIETLRAKGREKAARVKPYALIAGLCVVGSLVLSGLAFWQHEYILGGCLLLVGFGLSAAMGYVDAILWLCGTLMDQEDNERGRT